MVEEVLRCRECGTSTSCANPVIESCMLCDKCLRKMALERIYREEIELNSLKTE